MQLARSLAPAVLILAALFGSPDVRPAADRDPLVSLAVPTWPVSTLVIAEVQTGGASASDEFVEIANQGPALVDLVGLEVAYVTSSGSTVTRKATWATTTTLGPGQRILVGNVLGAYATISDATYSGGFAATGGALVLRPLGGAPIDAVAWGDAANAFVEGRAAAAPPAGSSIERLPGGLAGNGIDTNDNAADFAIAAPSPQGLAAPPVPAPGASPTPTTSPTPEPSPAPTAEPTAAPSPAPSATPGPSAPPGPTPTPTPDPTPAPTPDPTPSTTPGPTTAPTPLPTATPAPTPDPTPATTPTPAPTASPSLPASQTIASVRALPSGTTATVVGTLTTALDALEGARASFIQDETSGIAVYLDQVPPTSLPAGTVVGVTGTVDDRYAQRTLRAAASAIVPLGTAEPPPAIRLHTGGLGEPYEGLRVALSGTTVGSPTPYADGTGILLDDGTGPARVIVLPIALGGMAIPAGTAVDVVGPLGQRDSSGTGTSGYRVFVVLPNDIVSVAPTPPPPPTASPSATPASSTPPSPVPSPAPSPSATPAATMTVAAARALPVGSIVRVGGVITAEAGRLGLPPLLAIADPAGPGIVVRLADGMAPPARGAWIVVEGRLVAPYGQLEVRLAPGGLALAGTAALPWPLAVTAGDLGEATEGRLVSIRGTVAARPTRSSSGDLTVFFDDGSGTRFRILADASAGVGADAFAVGARYELAGIVGQRASRKDALDGYRIWIRDLADALPVEPAPTGGSAGPSGGPGPVEDAAGDPAAAAAIAIAAALRLGEGGATIEGIVTIPATLLDASGRRIVVADSTGAIEVLLPSGTDRAPAVGARLRVRGELGRAYGAPRLRAVEIAELGSGPLPPPVTVGGKIDESLEWRLVWVSGTVVDVARLGDRWRAELLVAGSRIAIVGQAGSGVPSTALVEGRRATIVGIVRRPYPTATDRRFAVLPRSAADIALGPADGAASGGARVDGGGGRGIASSRGGSAAPGAAQGTLDVDLAALAEHIGKRVRVGGIAVRALDGVIDLDDGTAVAAVHADGPAGEVARLVRAGDAINVVGTVVRLEDGTPALRVEDAAGIVRLGTLGQPLPAFRPGAAGAEDVGPGAPGQAPGVGNPWLDAGLGTASDPAMGLGAVLLLTLVSIAVAIVRRQVARRQLAMRIASRLSAIARPASRA